MYLHQVPIQAFHPCFLLGTSSTELLSLMMTICRVNFCFVVIGHTALESKDLVWFWFGLCVLCAVLSIRTTASCRLASAPIVLRPRHYLWLWETQPASLAPPARGSHLPLFPLLDFFSIFLDSVF